MKIEIVNRSHWRKRVKQLLEEIEEYNARVLWDRDYILAQLENKQWDKYHGRPKWLRWLIGPRSLKIGEVMYWDYYGLFLECRLKDTTTLERFLKALNSSNVGTIYLEDKEDWIGKLS